MDTTIRQQTIIHELGHAWIALQRGYSVMIEIGEQGNHSGQLITDPVMKPEDFLLVLAADFCAERVGRIPFQVAYSGARQDVEIIFDCLGEETALKLLNASYQFFRDYKDQFLAFVTDYSPALAESDRLSLAPSILI